MEAIYEKKQKKYKDTIGSCRKTLDDLELSCQTLLSLLDGNKGPDSDENQFDSDNELMVGK